MIEKIKKLKVGKIIENPLMKKYTTYKVGGEALAIVMPDDIKSLVKLIEFVNKNNVKYKILGNGSNVIFKDELYDGIIINLSKLDKFEVDGTIITVGAGYNLIKLAMKTAKLGLSGLEFASGIPGTVGGAVYMNAGAYKSDMGYVVSEVKVLTPDLKIKTMYNKDMDFHYRTSFLKKNPGFICLETKIVLKKGNKDEILALLEDRKQRRLISQPLEYPSAGSVFRNPTGDFAGRLVEEIGYKGKNIGGAYVSEKHANFIINKGDAKASDIKKLISEIQDKVKEKYDIELILEQEIIE